MKPRKKSETEEREISCDDEVRRKWKNSEDIPQEFLYEIAPDGNLSYAIDSLSDHQIHQNLVKAECAVVILREELVKKKSSVSAS